MADEPIQAWNTTPKSRGRGKAPPRSSAYSTSTRCEVCDAFPSWQRNAMDPRRLCEKCWREAQAQ